MDFSTAMGHVLDAYLAKGLVEWDCDNCEANGSIGEALFDSEGDARCPSCCSVVDVSDGTVDE